MLRPTPLNDSLNHSKERWGMPVPVILTVFAVAGFFAWWKSALVGITLAVGIPMDIRTAEIRTALWNWCIWRYRILKSSAKQDVGQSYYFLAAEVSAKYRDSDARKVAAVLAGPIPSRRWMCGRLLFRP